MLLASSFSVQAKSLVLTLTDGTLVYYYLEGETTPMMRFVDGKVTVEADTYTMSGIKNFYISNTDDPVGISSTTATPSFTFRANQFVLTGAQSSVVSICNAAGMRIDAPVQQTGECVSVDLSTVPNGTYIISNGKTSFKVYKK